MNLSDTIFSFFGRYYKQNDSYKDNAGRGVYERFQRLMGEEYDENLSGKADNFVQNIVPPELMEDRFVPLWEQIWSMGTVIREDIAFRRSLLSFILPVYKVLGTMKAYNIVFSLAGFTSVNVVPYGKAFTLDSSLQLDDPFRRLDTEATNFFDYRLELEGPMPDDGSTRQLIRLILEFVEPIYAQARVITYNSTEVVLDTVFVEIQDGDLQVDYENDQALTLTLKNGDLMADGGNADRYFVDDKGDLIYDPTL